MGWFCGKFFIRFIGININKFNVLYKYVLNF